MPQMAKTVLWSRPGYPQSSPGSPSRRSRLRPHATGTGNAGLPWCAYMMPHAEKIPSPPKMHVPTGRPLLKWLLPPPMKQRAWVDFKSLFDDGLAQARAFEEMLRSLANKPIEPSKTFRKTGC
jgi:hypothetical protein